MPTVVVLLWLGNIVLDTVGQLTFKYAAGDPRAGTGLARWRYMLARPWLWLGIACYVFEFLLWIAFLSWVPLSRGVLLGSINIVVIVVAGRVLFHDRLSRWHVAGISLVTLGVAFVGASA